VVGLLRALAAVQADREVVLCRELSKRFEEVVRGSLEDVSEQLAMRDRIRGECVVVVGPYSESRTTRVIDALEEGASLKQVAVVLAERWGVKKRTAYQQLLALERQLQDELDG
jgi:16S rRNA (cytidine1402-2'-O)-methyltransferase